jgi:hypothetical protein
MLDREEAGSNRQRLKVHSFDSLQLLNLNKMIRKHKNKGAERIDIILCLQKDKGKASSMTFQIFHDIHEALWFAALTRNCEVPPFIHESPTEERAYYIKQQRLIISPDSDFDLRSTDAELKGEDVECEGENKDEIEGDSG